MGWEPGGLGSTLAAACELSSEEFQICEVGITTLPPLTHGEKNKQRLAIQMYFQRKEAQIGDKS